MDSARNVGAHHGDELAQRPSRAESRPFPSGRHGDSGYQGDRHTIRDGAPELERGTPVTGTVPGTNPQKERSEEGELQVWSDADLDVHVPARRLGEAAGTARRYALLDFDVTGSDSIGVGCDGRTLGVGRARRLSCQDSWNHQKRQKPG